MNEHKYNTKIDVFSIGVVLYNLVTECILFPKDHKYNKLSQNDYYRYLKKKFKCIRKEDKVLNILYSCLAFDPEERLSVKQLLETYFQSEKDIIIPPTRDESQRRDTSTCKMDDNLLMSASPTALSNARHSENRNSFHSLSISSIDTIKSEIPIINDNIDEITEELLFSCCNVDGYRFDIEENKWRGRGNGILSLCFNGQTNLAKIIFFDIKYSKTRLLQWIDCDTKFRFVCQDEIGWNGKDYTMDTTNPFIADWRLKFNDPLIAKQFIDLFNYYNNKNINNNNNMNDIKMSNNCGSKQRKRRKSIITKEYDHIQNDRAIVLS